MRKTAPPTPARSLASSKGGGASSQPRSSVTSPAAGKTASRSAPVSSAKPSPSSGGPAGAKASSTTATPPAAATQKEHPLLVEEREAYAKDDARPCSSHRFDTPDALRKSLGGGGHAVQSVIDSEGVVLDRAKGVWIRREAEEAQVDTILGAAPSGHMLILADSGSGKSTFVARVVQVLRAREGTAKFDIVHSAFVGAVEGSTSVVRVLGDFCRALATDAGSQGESEIPRDLSGLASMFAELLTTLSQTGKRVVIAIDALNELETGRGLSWLPKDLPAGCHIILSSVDLEAGGSKGVMASAGEGGNGGGGSRQACLDIQRAVDRGGWSGGVQIVKLQGMTEMQKKEMLRQMVKAGVLSGGKSGSEAPLVAGVEHLEAAVKERAGAILGAEHGESPLYLRLAAEDIVRAVTGKGSMGEKLPGRVSLVFDMLLTELEEGYGSAPKAMLESVFCTQGGILPPQLLQILEECEGKFGSDGGEHAQGMWKGMWEGYFSAVVRVGAGGFVGFTHMQARDAVSRRYGLDGDSDGGVQLRAAHRRLARYFSNVVQNRGEEAVGVASVWGLCLSRLPEHLRLASAWQRLWNLLCKDLEFARLKLRAGLCHSLITDLSSALSSSPPTPNILQDFEDVLACVRGSGHILEHAPWMLGQQALNQRDKSACAKAAWDLPRAKDKVVLKWMNKPQTEDALTATFAGTRGNLIWACALSADGIFVALGGSDGIVRVIDSSSGEEIAALAGHKSEISRFAFDPTNPSILLSISSYSIREKRTEAIVWDIKEGGKLRDWSLTGCNAVDWSRCGKMIGLGVGGSLDLYFPSEDWRLDSDKSRTFTAGCAFSGDSKRIAVGADDLVKIYPVGASKDKTSSLSVLVLKGHRDEGDGSGSEVNSVAWGDGKYLASGSSDHTVRVWDTTGKGACVCVLKGHYGIVVSVSMSLDSNKVMSASTDKTAKLWSMPKAGWGGASSAGATSSASSAGATSSASSTGAASSACIATLRGHSDDLQHVCLDRKGGEVALTSSDDGTARMWSVSKAAKSKDPPGHTNPSSPITACVWCLLDKQLVIISSDCNGGVRCFKADGQSMLWKTRLYSSDRDNKEAVTSLAGSECLAKVVCGMYQRLHVIDTKDGRITQTLKFPEWVNVCCISKGNNFLAVGGEESHLWVFQGSGGGNWKETFRLDSSFLNCDLSACCFDGKGEKLASGGSSGDVALWDVKTGSLLHRFTSAASIMWCTFSPCGQILAACDKEGVLKMLSVSKGLELLSETSPSASLAASRPSLSWCAFTPKGRHLVTSSASKMVYVWSVEGFGKNVTLCGMFPALGSFGSPDGIGGQGCVDGGKLVIGDRGGLLYLLSLDGL